MFEEIDLSFNAEQENFQKIETQISLPYLFNYKFGISTKLDIFREKENYTNVSTVSSLNYISKQDIVLSIKYQRKNSLSENNLLLNIKENNIGAGLEYRYKANELKISSFIVRSNISDESNASLSTTINSLNEIRVSKKIKVTIKSNSSLKFKKDLYDNEMLIFGGSNSLRGFNENEFKANKFIISSINISYDLDKKSDASIFYEQGFFEKRLYTEDKEVGWPRSIGTGVNIHTSSGKFYLQYAIGIYEDMRFNLQNGKVHIGIQNRF